MTASDRETYQYLLDAGWTRQELDKLVRAGEPQPVMRTVNRRLADSAMRLDVLEARIEQARLERHQETVAKLRRLGFDTTELRPPLTPSPHERHLARALAGTAADPLRPGLIKRPNSGEVLAVY